MTKLSKPLIAPYGDSAIYLQYPAEDYSAAANEAVLDLAEALRSSGDWEDVISGYDSLVGVFKPSRLTLSSAAKAIEAALTKKTRAKKSVASKVVDIPVYYGGAHGPDMDNIIKSSGLSEAQIIAAHSGQPYRVCMMGFVPGFTFLSEAPKKLHHPRHTKPRVSVPAGSVGIAGWQTGIYGLSSPGGWQIIGRTNLSIFDASRDTPFLLSAGDSLRFVPMDGPFPEEAKP